MLCNIKLVHHWNISNIYKWQQHRVKEYLALCIATPRFNGRISMRILNYLSWSIFSVCLRFEKKHWEQTRDSIKLQIIFLQQFCNFVSSSSQDSPAYARNSYGIGSRTTGLLNFVLTKWPSLGCLGWNTKNIYNWIYSLKLLLIKSICHWNINDGT